MKIEIFTTEKIKDAEIVNKYNEKCYLTHDLNSLETNPFDMKEKALNFINSEYPKKAKKVHYRHFEELPENGFMEINIYFTNPESNKDEFIYDGYHEKEVKFIDGTWFPVD